MKELSIEQKVQRYDEALKRAKKLYEQGTITESLSYVFPELRESEDERIRKALTQNLKERFETKGNMGEGLDMPDVLAWLEKQCEQKPTDKVEPKFHEGEWVVDNAGYIWKIKGMLNQFYILEDVGGGESRPTIEWADNTFHLWIIQDAKPGDVLATDKSVFIYAKVLYNKPYAYCGVDKFSVFKDNCLENDWSNSLNNIYPATKEQRDTLMNAMADAGYTFDFEKKELKKIDPIDEYEGLTDFERTVANICIGWIGKEYGWKKYIKDNADILLKIAVEKFNSVQDATFEQKPTNKEMKELLHTEYEKGRADAISEMKNPAWSEVDKDFMYDTLSNLTELKDRYGEGYGNVGKCIDWLKSLKPQNHWKPTEAQLASLTIACDRNDRIGFDLTQLLEDLKKL